MTYDVIVLGSGPAGVYFAKTAAGYNKKVLVIEKELIGGTGFRTGCLPVKKYLDGLRKAHLIEQSAKMIGVKQQSIKQNTIQVSIKICH